MMTDLFDTLAMYFEYSFVWYALVVGVLIAFCSALLGVTLVLKRFSFIGDGLSHTAFGASTIASVLAISNHTSFVLPVTILVAVVILCARENSKIKGDASLALISVGSLAFGYFLLSIFAPPTNLAGDICRVLFGSTLILTLSSTDVVLSIVLSVLVILFFLLFYNRVFAITFDEDFSSACGTRTRMLNVMMAVVIAVIVVLSMNLVGSLLISALIIFPAVSAMLLFRSFLGVTVFSCAFSVFTALIGIFGAILFGTPVGSTIVMADLVCFILCKLVSLAKR